MERLTTAKKIEFELREQGRKKSWLAEQLNISRPTLDKRLRDNTFTAWEIIRLKQIFNW